MGDNFPWRFDYFVINYLGVVDISMSLEVSLQYQIRTSNFFTDENTSPHVWR